MMTAISGLTVKDAIRSGLRCEHQTIRWTRCVYHLLNRQETEFVVAALSPIRKATL